MPQSTSVGSNSPILKTHADRLDSEEVTNHCHRNIQTTESFGGKEGQELGPDRLVLPGRSHPMSPEDYAQSQRRDPEQTAPALVSTREA